MAKGITEFSLIDRFFKRPCKNSSINLGIGDDCALLDIPADSQLAVTADTMVENVHFFSDCDPYDLGHKLLAVNLSDLASMGAKPLAVTLALTLTKPDPDWLERFSEGFFNLAGRYGVDLIGGDTTSGPLCLTVQAFGLVPRGQALRRSGAQPGDIVCVTGLLGEAGLGLKIRQGSYYCPQPLNALRCFNRPEPQLKVGQALLGVASSCIDISDGLTGDLGHILTASQVGACLDESAIPISTQVKDYIQATDDWQMPLTAGDDYELCFTISAAKRADITHIPHYQIGVIESEPGLRIRRFDQLYHLENKSFEHFS